MKKNGKRGQASPLPHSNPMYVEILFSFITVLYVRIFDTDSQAKRIRTPAKVIERYMGFITVIFCSLYLKLPYQPKYKARYLSNTASYTCYILNSSFRNRTVFTSFFSQLLELNGIQFCRFFLWKNKGVSLCSGSYVVSPQFVLKYVYVINVWGIQLQQEFHQLLL